MQYNSKSTIKSVEDVKEFFAYMINDLGVSLHTDTPFCEYINTNTDEPTFTSEECRLYDRLMQEAFEVCSKSGDKGLIYDIGTEILKAHIYKETA